MDATKIHHNLMVFMNGLLMQEGNDYHFNVLEQLVFGEYSKYESVTVIDLKNDKRMDWPRGNDDPSLKEMEEAFQALKKTTTKKRLKEIVIQSNLDNFEKVKLIKKYKLGKR